MTVHTCSRCPLRFTTRAELTDHMAHDHSVPAEVLQVMTYPGAREAQPLYRSFTADDDVHRILLIANQTLGSESVMATIGARQRAHERISVFVLVPATPSEHLTSAPGAGMPASAARGIEARTDDAGLAQARWRLRQAVGMLTDAGVVAHGRIGDANPVVGASQVIAEEQVDEIVLFTLDRTLSRWLHADVPTSLRRMLDVPVTVVSPAMAVGDDQPARQPPGTPAGIDLTDPAPSAAETAEGSPTDLQRMR